MELRLIPDFSGDNTQNVVEWLEKAELVCNLLGIAHLESVIPLRLTVGAFAVYQQLLNADKQYIGKITKALRTALLLIRLQFTIRDEEATARINGRCVSGGAAWARSSVWRIKRQHAGVCFCRRAA